MQKKSAQKLAPHKFGGTAKSATSPKVMFNFQDLPENRVFLQKLPYLRAYMKIVIYALWAFDWDLILRYSILKITLNRLQAPPMYPGRTRSNEENISTGIKVIVNSMIKNAIFRFSKLKIKKAIKCY